MTDNEEYNNEKKKTHEKKKTEKRLYMVDGLVKILTQFHKVMAKKMIAQGFFSKLSKSWQEQELVNSTFKPNESDEYSEENNELVSSREGMDWSNFFDLSDEDRSFVHSLEGSCTLFDFEIPVRRKHSSESIDSARKAMVVFNERYKDVTVGPVLYREMFVVYKDHPPLVDAYEQLLAGTTKKLQDMQAQIDEAKLKSFDGKIDEKITGFENYLAARTKRECGKCQLLEMMLQKYWQKKEVKDAQTMTGKSGFALVKNDNPLSQHEQVEKCLDALPNDRATDKQTLLILAKFLKKLDRALSQNG